MVNPTVNNQGLVPPLTLRCVKGEEWLAMSFKSFVKGQDNPLTEASIVFSCPAGHSFTLETALKKCIFTPAQAQRLIAAAREWKEEYWREKDFLVRPSGIIPTEEIKTLNLLCVRCGGIARWVPIGIRIREAKNRWPEFALCLVCAADWLNHDEAFELLNRTRGRPHQLFWEIMLKRFCQKAPPLGYTEAEKLLQDCRKQARRKQVER